MERVKTYITGLDKLLEGGFLKGSCVLLQGPPGTGKTIFGLQFLYQGCTKSKDSGMLIQIEEYDKTLYWYSKLFGWDLSREQKKGKLAIFSLKPRNYEKFSPAKLEGEMLGKLKNIMEPMQIKRVVIDSISPLRSSMANAGDYRSSFYETVNFLKEMEATSVIVSDTPSQSSFEETSKLETSIVTPEEHICDGVIKLRHAKNTKEKEYNKQLLISKMTATNPPIAWYPVTITKKLGFTVKPFL